MKEFWTVLGLAVVDEPFRARLLEARRDREELTKLLNREYCFHLSRFEVKELQDFISHDKVIRCMEDMHGFWRPSVCEVSLTFDKRYVHVKPSEDAMRAIMRLAEKEHGGAESPEEEREHQALHEFVEGWKRAGEHS